MLELMLRGGDEDRSRSPLVLTAIEEAVIGAVFGADGLKAELNSPNPSEALLTLRTTNGGGAACFAETGFGGGFGPVSKKLPPAKGGRDTLWAGLVNCGGAGLALI